MSAAQQQPVLEITGVHSYYGSIQALKGISLEVREGEIVTLLGANGAGKSTTLRSVNGLIHPRRGSIRFEGKDITRTPAHEIVKRGISQSPEGRRLFPRMTVLENLEMGAYQRKDKENFHADFDNVFTLFPRLAERRDQKAGTMSGGEQQMCAIGRGIMARPKLLIIDELSLGLAPAVVETLAESLPKIRAQNLSVLLVEQDVATAFEISDYGYVMESGRVALHGRSSDLLARPDVRDVYLGIA
jgi:branched-chain amino acid transport system ATP-binding protein